MHTTRIFRNGNSQAVRIPAELAYDHTGLEVEIERIGDELRIRPARPALTMALERFARFSPDVFGEERGEHAQNERDAL